jgi:hypothetical protein
MGFELYEQRQSSQALANTEGAYSDETFELDDFDEEQRVSAYLMRYKRYDDGVVREEVDSRKILQGVRAEKFVPRKVCELCYFAGIGLNHLIRRLF